MTMEYIRKSVVMPIPTTSVMNHGDARHFVPYGRLGGILGAVGISVVVRVDSVQRVGIHRFM